MIYTTVEAKAMVRILSAVGLLSLSIATPSIGASVDSAGRMFDESSGQFGVKASPSDTWQNPAQTLTAIEIEKEDPNITILISGDGTLLYEESQLDSNRVIVDIPNVSSGIRKSLVHVDHPLLKQIRLGTHADRVRVVFDIAGKANYSVKPLGDKIIVKLVESTSTEMTAGEVRAGARQHGEVGSVSEKVWDRQELPRGRRINRVKTVGLQAAPAVHIRPVQMSTESDGAGKHTPEQDLVLGETRYVGRRISLDFQQADISNVLRLIADVSGFNIVIGEGVKSKVTMKLVSVPWDQALDMILKMNGLGKIKQGNILWIDSLANIAKQQDEEARTKDSKVKAEELVDRVFYVRNLQAQELLTSLRQNLSPRGVMQVSQGTNA